MHLLYLDESGSVAAPNQKHFVLAGISVFERTTHWLEQELNKIAERFCPNDPHSIELHGSPMRSGREGWKTCASLSDRLQAIKDALHCIHNHKRNVRLFGAVINKSSLSGKDPVECAFEQISSRFDLFLKRLHTKHNNPQRGIILFDKASTEIRIQTLAREFKYIGNNWGKTNSKYPPAEPGALIGERLKGALKP